MQKLSKLVLDKIVALGMDEAALFFDRSKVTLKNWQNAPNKIPVEAAEKVLSEEKPEEDPAPVTAYEISTIATQPDATSAPPSDDELKLIWEKLNELHQRVRGCETAIRKDLGLPPLGTAQTVTVPPQTKPPPGVQQLVPPPATVAPHIPSAGEPGAWMRPRPLVTQRF